MLIPALLLWLAGAAGPAQTGQDRYFKEDHLTGAAYIRLAADGTYTITGREHMGLWVYESGRWEVLPDSIRFLPTERGKEAYSGTETKHRQRTFLAFATDAAPSIVIPVDEIKRELDSDPNVLPPYVFFEIEKAVYERETKEPYPFRIRQPLSGPAFPVASERTPATREGEAGGQDMTRTFATAALMSVLAAQGSVTPLTDANCRREVCTVSLQDMDIHAR